MNLQTAIELATLIDASAQAELIAIGRFLPPAQITRSSPWGCSVRLPDGTAQTVWSVEQCMQILDPAEASPVGIAESATPAASAVGSQGAGVGSQESPARRDAVHLRQPSLF